MAADPLASTANATTGGTPVGTTVGKQTGSESSLSNWVGPYVTEMLGKGQALSNTPFQAYTGPLTAGQSDLQKQAFSGIAGLAMPTTMGAYTPQSITGITAKDATTGQSEFDKYMSPYLQSALDPQLAEARRQAEISRVQDMSRLTQAGGYGGSRQAIMESEGQRNLQQNLAGITGKGYQTAYDQALGQFNLEQQRKKEAQEMSNQYGMGLVNAQAGLGETQRGIASQDIAARKAQFEEERDYPFKAVQYQQSLLQGLPVATSAYSYQQPSGMTQLLNSVGGVQQLYDMIFGGTPK